MTAASSLYRLQTHYSGARDPHVVTYTDASEVIAAAEHRRKVHAGVTAVVVSAVDRHPGLAPINGCAAILKMERR